jgi:hypothetical protein
MSNAANYRILAADCEARARREVDPLSRAEWERMALGYRRLAFQADRNAQTDVMYETPTRQQPQVQQQQQQQSQAKAADDK